MDLGVIIPVRGLELSKQTLRSIYPTEEVSMVVENLLLDIVSLVQQCSLDPVVLTADANLMKDLDVRSIQSIWDKGESLNRAIKDALDQIKHKRVMLVMADLPGFSLSVLKKILYISQIFEYLIVPASDGGTAVAILPSELMKEGLFGKDSSLKIVNLAAERSIPLSIFYTEDLSRDLDDQSDWEYWNY